MTAYKLVRTKRKTLSIHISSSAEVIVHSPLKLSVKIIDEFIIEKQDWITKKLDEVNQINKNKQDIAHIKQGDTLLYMGNEYPVIYGTLKSAKFDGNQFVIPQADFEITNNAITKLYKKLAKEIILERVYIYQKIVNVKPLSIKITSAKKRWGSCSGKNNLNFSWLLIMADIKEIDYVVVHELTHIKQHNHSSKFWALVFDVMPDYKLREKRLKEIQKKI